MTLESWFDAKSGELPEAFEKAVGMCKALDSQDEDFVAGTLASMRNALEGVSQTSSL